MFVCAYRIGRLLSYRRIIGIGWLVTYRAVRLNVAKNNIAGEWVVVSLCLIELAWFCAMKVDR